MQTRKAHKRNLQPTLNSFANQFPCAVTSNSVRNTYPSNNSTSQSNLLNKHNSRINQDNLSHRNNSLDSSSTNRDTTFQFNHSESDLSNIISDETLRNLVESNRILLTFTPRKIIDTQIPQDMTDNTELKDILALGDHIKLDLNNCSNVKKRLETWDELITTLKADDKSKLLLIKYAISNSPKISKLINISDSDTYQQIKTKLISGSSQNDFKLLTSPIKADPIKAFEAVTNTFSNLELPEQIQLLSKHVKQQFIDDWSITCTSKEDLEKRIRNMVALDNKQKLLDAMNDETNSVDKLLQKLEIKKETKTDPTEQLVEKLINKIQEKLDKSESVNAVNNNSKIDYRNNFSNNNNQLCNYHTRYGKRAMKCTGNGCILFNRYFDIQDPRGFFYNSKAGYNPRRSNQTNQYQPMQQSTNFQQQRYQQMPMQPQQTNQQQQLPMQNQTQQVSQQSQNTTSEMSLMKQLIDLQNAMLKSKNFQ